MLKKLLAGVNIDQVMSLGNHAVGVLAAVLMAWGIGTDITNLVTGVFLAGFSFAVGVWMNGDNLFDAIQSVMRKVLAMVLAFAAMRGWIREDWFPAITTTVATVLPIIWSMLFYGDKPGPNFPGTTVVDPVRGKDVAAAVAAEPHAEPAS